jgi:proteasome lid subunit RPN8/RPN11
VTSKIQLTNEIAVAIVERARKNPAEECCGLLAGRDGVITHMIPANNAAGQPSTAYEIAPEQLFELMRQIRVEGLELLGIYHSHPAGENQPSARDIDRAYYPDAAYFILSPRLDAQKPIRAFSIRNGRASELDVEIV